MGKQIVIDKEKFHEMAYSEACTMRRMLFDLETEDYGRYPAHVEHKRRWWHEVAIIPWDEWKAYDEYVSDILGDLAYARDLVKLMEPVFVEFYEKYQDEHKFERYLQNECAAYDAENFERVRDRFEEEYNRKMNIDEEQEREA